MCEVGGRGRWVSSYPFDPFERSFCPRPLKNRHRLISNLLKKCAQKVQKSYSVSRSSNSGLISIFREGRPPCSLCITILIQPSGSSFCAAISTDSTSFSNTRSPVDISYCASFQLSRHTDRAAAVLSLRPRVEG